MGLGDLVSRTVHTATAVPRLYGAALRTGIGPVGAAQVLGISEAALRTAATHGRGVPGRINALRHFMWQAVLTARFGIAVSGPIATAQEDGTPAHRDSRVDAHNNAVGQDYGAAHARDLQDGSVSEVMERLVPVALEKWEADELIWVRPH
ncbi:hypothetical protein [Nocardioides sp.]|uniref:DUF6973 domain-containing protein n=1 Tax=Nocardioides sp. TaxID=35761 RepID=UPI002619FFBB|nr:hypothetical protein [Nocardioides sp.]MCW2739576.1 hypothetical protein [Nocardioides sp.]